MGLTFKTTTTSLEMIGFSKTFVQSNTAGSDRKQKYYQSLKLKFHVVHKKGSV
jgi:hypothetical protein